VRDERHSVLWLCGPPGAGKSAVGWALYDGLARSGARAGFVDMDQLGMCFPAPPDDPEEREVKLTVLEPSPKPTPVGVGAEGDEAPPEPPAAESEASEHP